MPGARVLKAAAIILAALAVLVVAAVLVLRSSRFHRFVLAEAIQKADKATGGRVEIGNFAFHWDQMHADLYDVALHGTEPASAPPLLQADHIGITLNLISIWEHKVNLQEIVVDHPVVHYLVDASGHSNLPHAPPRPPGSEPVNLFNLAIGHLIVSRGELYDNDRKAPLEAELRGVQAQVTFAARNREYDGQLSYRDGRIQYGRYNPLRHDLDVQFAAAPYGLTIHLLRLSSGSSVFTAQANLQDYANPAVEGSYQADLSMNEIARIMNNADLPSGAIATRGVLHYQNDLNRPFLERISVQGQISSSSLALESPEARVRIQAVSGVYSLDQGNFEARNVRLDALGGHVAARGAVKNLTGREEGSLEASVQGLSLEAFNAALRSAPLDASRLSGRMDGTVSASWLGKLNNLQARADATLTASEPVQSAIAASSSAIPLNGTVHASYDGRSSTISLHDTYFQTPHSALKFEGTLAKQSMLQIRAQSNDLGEIDLLAISLRRRFSEQRKAPVPQLLGLRGSASFKGQLQGTTRAPRLSGQLDGQNIAYEGATLPLIRASVEASPSGLSVHQGQLRIGSQGSVQFDAALGLDNWSFTAEEPVRIQLNASGVPLQDIQHLANRQYPVSGIISATLAVQGSENSPSGTGFIRLSSGSAWGQPIQNLSVQFQGDGNSIRSTIRLQAPAEAGNARLTFQPRTERYDLQGDFLGIRIEELQLAQIRKLQISGIVNVTAQAQGTIQSPELTAVIIAPKLQIRQQNLDGLQVRAGVASQQAAFTVSSSVSGTAIQGQGTVQLIPPYDATAHIDTGTIQLAPVLGSILQQPAAAFRGQMALHAFLHGPLKDPTQIQATLSVPYLSVGYQSLDLASSAPITADYRYGTVTLPGADFKGTAMNLHVEGAVPLLSNGSMHASAAGNMDLRIIQAALPGWSTSGQLHLNLSAQGTRRHPQFHGTAQIADAAILSTQAPLGVQKLNADFDIEQERISIRSLTAQSGGGTITGQGFVTYQPPRFNLAVSAKDVRLSYPQGVRTVLESNLTLIGSPRSAVLAGQVLLDRVSVDKDFNVASLMDQFSGPSSPPSAEMAQNIQLNVAVRSTRQMDVSTGQLSIEGAVALQVRGTLATPIILGRTEISSGEVFFNGNRFQVQNGVIEFDNPTRTEPVLNLDVTTTISQYTVSVRFAGPLDHMRTTYTSDPPLAPVDVINLLVTGHPSEASSSNPNTPESVVAGQLASQVSGRVERLAGISSLTIDPQIGGSGTNAGTRLAVQQRVTKNLFFTFATNISSTEDPLIQVEYQATKRFSVSALRDQNGNYSLEIGMHKRF